MHTAGLQSPNWGRSLERTSPCPPPTPTLLNDTCWVGRPSQGVDAAGSLRLLQVSVESQQKHRWKCSHSTRHTACTYHPATCTARGFPVQPLLLGKRIRRKMFRPHAGTVWPLTGANCTQADCCPEHPKLMAWFPIQLGGVGEWEAWEGVGVTGCRAGPAAHPCCVTSGAHVNLSHFPLQFC